jgi:dihydropteroate synthase
MAAKSIALKRIVWGDHQLDFSRAALIMGILNVTPDSFSDGGHFFSFDEAVLHGERLEEQGADILDVGGESTRPFSEAISEQEEISRVVPVIEKLAKKVNIPISIDTTKSKVARRALDAGASIINDVGALRLDPKMAGLAAEKKVPIILMHMKGLPGDMQIAPYYEDLLGEIKRFLADRIKYAVDNGIEREKIIIDPGIGFGKTLEHNLKLIHNLSEFKELNAPILIGPSRKAFIRTLLKNHYGKEFKPDAPEVETGSKAAVAASILNGAHIVRVHNVSGVIPTIKITDAVKNHD